MICANVKTGVAISHLCFINPRRGRRPSSLIGTSRTIVAAHLAGSKAALLFLHPGGVMGRFTPQASAGAAKPDFS
jgi:hypothetical protein